MAWRAVSETTCSRWSLNNASAPTRTPIILRLAKVANAAASIEQAAARHNNGQPTAAPIDYQYGLDRMDQRFPVQRTRLV